MTFNFYLYILLPSISLYFIIFLIEKKTKKKYFLKRIFFFLWLFSAIGLIAAFIRGYYFFDQEKYGKMYNKERLVLRIDTIPESFHLVKSPIQNWKDYFNKHQNYRLVYQSNDIDSGHFRKEIEVLSDELLREEDFYINAYDTIISSYNYRSESRSNDTLFTQNINMRIQ